MNGSVPIRVVIADDHPVVRAGIASMLGKEPDIRVVGEVGDGSHLERMVVETAPDVLVLDMNMPNLNPVAAARRLTAVARDLRILVLTAYDDEAYVMGLLAAGAAGYMLKDEAVETVATAVRAVARGESWLSQRIAGRLARKAIARADTVEAEPLTSREREVLRLLAHGLSNEEIGERLCITKRTVQNHVSAVYGKLRLDSRAEAVLYALRHGIADVGEAKRL